MYTISKVNISKEMTLSKFIFTVISKFQCWTSFYSIYYCDVYGVVKSCNIGVWSVNTRLEFLKGFLRHSNSQNCVLAAMTIVRL